VRAYIILLPVQHYLLTFFYFPFGGSYFIFSAVCFCVLGVCGGSIFFFRCDVGAFVSLSGNGIGAFGLGIGKPGTGNREMGNGKWETGNWELEKISRVYTDLGLGIWDLGFGTWDGAVHARLGVLGTGLGQTRQRLFGWLG
jgi:hypothetical protein